MNFNPIPILSYSSLNPLGKENLQVWNSLKNGKTGLKYSEVGGKACWTARLPETEEDLVNLIAQKYSQLDRTCLLALACAQDLKPLISTIQKSQSVIAINVGSSRGATGIWEQLHASFLKSGKVPATCSPLTTLGNISSWLAHELACSGPTFSHSVTCSTSAYSIANAIAWLNAGLCDYFIAGGSEAPLTPFSIAQMQALGIYAKETSATYPCAPCVMERENFHGIVLGEASCLFLLASPTANLSTPPIAYIQGLGTAMEQINSPTSIDEDGQGFQLSMSRALAQCSDPIDAVVLHAPGTKKGDLAEVRAVQNIFEKKLPQLISNKWAVGHTFGAASALSLQLALLILEHQEVPAFPYTTFFGSRETQTSATREIKRVMVNSAGFGGNSVSIIVSKAE